MDPFYRTQDRNVKVASGVLARRRKLSGSLACLEQFLATVRQGNRPSLPLFPDSKSPKATFAERRGSQGPEITQKYAKSTNRTRFFSIPGSLASTPIPAQSSNPPKGHFCTRSEVLIAPVKSPLSRTNLQDQFTRDRRDYEKSLYTIIGHAGTSRYLTRHRLSP